MPTERSLILSVAVDALFHTVLVFSLYLLFAGHNAPGGGFVGGLVAGAAFVLRYVDGGAPAVVEASRYHPAGLLGAGLALAMVTGAGSWLWGLQLFESGKLEVDLPVIGTMKATSALPFDIGVYLVVVGLVLVILQVLGGEQPETAAADEEDLGR